ncbi:MAG: MoaD/ThiS family protein [Planctomycetales bacterium]|nr:MoaD/ThiS family protein [Planctomycetales bacterium]
MPLVFIPAQIRSLTGGKAQIELTAGSVREVVEVLESRFPGIKERLCQGDELAPGLQLSIDHVMSSRGLRTKLKPGSEVHFLPAFGGG